MPRGDRTASVAVTGQGSRDGCLGEVLQLIQGQHQRSGPVQASSPLLQEPSPVFHLRMQGTGYLINKTDWLWATKIVGLAHKDTKESWSEE